MQMGCTTYFEIGDINIFVQVTGVGGNGNNLSEAKYDVHKE